MVEAPGGRTEEGQARGEKTVDLPARQIGPVGQTARLAWQGGPGKECGSTTEAAGVEIKRAKASRGGLQVGHVRSGHVHATTAVEKVGTFSAAGVACTWPPTRRNT